MPLLNTFSNKTISETLRSLICTPSSYYPNRFPHIIYFLWISKFCIYYKIFSKKSINSLEYLNYPIKRATMDIDTTNSFIHLGGVENETAKT